MFVPLAEAVCFAMLASYLLSRTLVPTMAKYLLVAQIEEGHEGAAKSRNPFVQTQQKFEQGFEKLRERYHRLLEICIHHSRIFVICFFSACVLSFVLLPMVGQDFFPAVDSGEFKLHLRAPTGTRIEETAALCERVDDDIRRLIPKSELATIIDNIGVPYSGLNLSYSNSAPIGPGAVSYTHLDVYKRQEHSIAKAIGHVEQAVLIQADYMSSFDLKIFVMLCRN